jgi:hypothetical protein
MSDMEKKFGLLMSGSDNERFMGLKIRRQHRACPDDLNGSIMALTFVSLVVSLRLLQRESQVIVLNQVSIVQN